MKRLLSYLILLTITFQIYAQDYFEMECIGVETLNEDSISVAEKYLGSTIKVPKEVRTEYDNVQRLYWIDNIPYKRFSQTEYLYSGIDYWIVYNKAIFSSDYSNLKLEICRPLVTAMGARNEKRIITLSYILKEKNDLKDE